MSNNQVPDIGEMYEWWKLRNDVAALLILMERHETNPALLRIAGEVLDKIESLGKKEGE